MPVASGWLILEDAFESHRIHTSETRFAIGNGMLDTRGTLEEGYPRERRTTLVHGVCDARELFPPQLAPVPDWIGVDIDLAGERFSLEQGEPLTCNRGLDVRNGLPTRSVL